MKMKDLSSTALCTLAIALTMSLPSAVGQSNSSTQQPAAQSTSQSSTLSQRSLERITKEVRHQLVLLPFYSVFDILGYKVSPGGSVTLIVQEVNPTLMTVAENDVRYIDDE